MSWTIERIAQNEVHIKELGIPIEAAAKARILMFCAANDQGVDRNQSFPASSGTKNLFKIGAAEAFRSVVEMGCNPADVDFILPGHKVVMERPNDVPVEKCRTLTGSSVATAIDDSGRFRSAGTLLCPT